MKRLSFRKRAEVLQALRRDGADLRAVARVRGAREEMLARWLLGPDAAKDALEHCAAQVMLAHMHLSEHRREPVKCLVRMVRDKELRRAHPEVVRRAAVDLATLDLLGLASAQHRTLAADIEEERIDLSLRKVLYESVKLTAVEAEVVSLPAGEAEEEEFNAEGTEGTEDGDGEGG